MNVELKRPIDMMLAPDVSHDLKIEMRVRLKDLSLDMSDMTFA